MKREEIISKVKSLALPEGSFVVFGAGPLAAAGIREANDIDMYVTPEVIEQKKALGWQLLDKGGRDIPLVHDCFELHTNWDFGHGYDPAFVDILARATVIDGVPFASLADVREWKVVAGRPKDLIDIELMDKYLAENLKEVA